MRPIVPMRSLRSLVNVIKLKTPSVPHIYMCATEAINGTECVMPVFKYVVFFFFSSCKLQRVLNGSEKGFYVTGEKWRIIKGSILQYVIGSVRSFFFIFLSFLRFFLPFARKLTRTWEWHLFGRVDLVFKSRNPFPSGIYSSINWIMLQVSALRATAQIINVSVPRSHNKKKKCPARTA